MLNKYLNTILFASLILMSSLVSSCASKRKVVKENEIINTVEQEQPMQNMPANTVYFAYNSHKITHDGAKVIDTFVENTNANSILVEGHCDVRGSDEYNMALGEKRANAVKKHIHKMHKGCAKNGSALQITTSSKGRNELISMGTTEEDHAKNRRAILITNSGN